MSETWNDCCGSAGGHHRDCPRAQTVPYDDDAPGERLARLMHHAEELAQYARELSRQLDYNSGTRMMLREMGDGINTCMEALYKTQDMVIR